MRSSARTSARPIAGAIAIAGLAAGLLLQAADARAAVTADRFGGFEDCLSYGEGAGKAAPGVARAYEALVIAQAPQSTRRAPLAGLVTAEVLRAAGVCRERAASRTTAGPADAPRPPGGSRRVRELKVLQRQNSFAEPWAYCRYGGEACGKPAADEACRHEGFLEADSWEVMRAPAPKAFWVAPLGYDQYCRGECKAFELIRCWSEREAYSPR